MRGKPRSYKEWKVADDPLVHLDVCTSGGRVTRVLAAANWPGLWRCEMWGHQKYSSMQSGRQNIGKEVDVRYIDYTYLKLSSLILN